MKNKGIFIIFVLIILLGIILFVRIGNFSILADNNRLYNIQQISSNSNSYTYQLQIKTSNPLSENLACGADVVNSIKVDDTIQWTNDRPNFDNTGIPINVNLPDNIQYNQPFQASSVGFNGLAFVIAPSGCGSTTPTYTDNGTYCIAYNKNYIRCVFNGELTTGGQFRTRPVGDWTASVQVNLLKAGMCSGEKCEGTNNYLCTNNAWVLQGQIDGKCGYASSTAVCTTGQEKCDLFNSYLCENSQWVNKGLISGKCGYSVGNASNTEILDKVLFNVGDFEFTVLYLLFLVGGLILLLIIKK